MVHLSIIRVHGDVHKHEMKSAKRWRYELATKGRGGAIHNCHHHLNPEARVVIRDPDRGARVGWRQPAHWSLIRKRPR